MIGSFNRAHKVPSQPQSGSDIVNSCLKFLDSKTIDSKLSGLEFLFCWKAVELRLSQDKVMYLINPDDLSVNLNHIMSPEVASEINTYKQRIKDGVTDPEAGLNLLIIKAGFILYSNVEVMPDGEVISLEAFKKSRVEARIRQYEQELYWGRFDAGVAKKRLAARSTKGGKAAVIQALTVLQTEINAEEHPYERYVVLDNRVTKPSKSFYTAPSVEYTKEEWKQELLKLDGDFKRKMETDLVKYDADLDKLYASELNRINKSESNYRDDCKKFNEIVLSYFDPSTKDTLISYLSNGHFRAMKKYLYEKYHVNEESSETVMSLTQIMSNLCYNESEIDLREFLKFFETVRDIINMSNQSNCNDVNSLIYLKNAINRGRNRYKNVFDNLEFNDIDVDINNYTSKLIHMFTKNAMKSHNEIIERQTLDTLKQKYEKKQRTDTNSYVNLNSINSNNSGHSNSSKEGLRNVSGGPSFSNSYRKESCTHCGKTNHKSEWCFKIFKCPACDNIGTCIPARCYTIASNINAIANNTYRKQTDNSNMSNGTSSASVSSSSSTIPSTLSSSSSTESNISLADQFTQSHPRPRYSN